jgi:hypothetical protein
MAKPGTALTALLCASTGCLSNLVPEHHTASPASIPGKADTVADLGGLGTMSDIGASFSDLTGASSDLAAFSLKIEAESGTLTDPMAALNDPNASGNQYIVCPATTVGGKAVFALNNIPDGMYAIWGRVIAPADANNSFHFSLDADNIDNDASDGASTIWDITITATYAWSRVNMRIDAAMTDQDQTYHLNGNHVIYLNEREDSTQLDQFLVTSDLNAIPQ